MEKLKSPVIAPECVAVVFVPTGSKETEKVDSTSSPGRKIRTGKDLFRELIRENKHSVWNKTLSESVRAISFVGYLEPWTILVKGSEKYLETLRDAYARRILKPPRNFAIVQFGKALTGLCETFTISGRPIARYHILRFILKLVLHFNRPSMFSHS